MMIKQKFSAIFVTIAAIPILIFGFLSFQNSKKILKREILTALNVIADFKEGEILLYLKNLKTRTTDFASDGFIVNSLERISQNNENLKTINELNSHLLLNKQPLGRNLLKINILNLEGKVIASTHSKSLGVDKSMKSHF